MNLAWLYPPYDYISNAAIHALARYTDQDASEVTRICIVGVHNGDEVPQFLRRYPNAHIHLYEPSARYLPRLKRRFGGNSRITLREVAASNATGQVTFFETSLHGAGSLLEIGEKGAENFGLSQAEATEVEAVRLDDDFPGPNCDCLWIDVQGAELMVLEGGENLLDATRAIHIEVSSETGLYKGDCDFDQITGYLRAKGFQLKLLGMDGIQGNAFYTRS